MNSLAAILASPASGVSEAVTGYPIGRGDGANTVFAAPPEITAVSALYRRDWQGTVALSKSARTNIRAYSEPVVANLAVGGSPIPTNTTFTVPGYKTVNAIYYGASPTASQSTYIQVNITAGLVYSMLAVIKMDDGSQPVLGFNSSSGDFCFVIDGNVSGGTIVYRNVGAGLWLVILQGYTAISGGSRNTGVVKFTTQSSKAFTVSCFQVEQASSCGAYLFSTTAPVTLTDYSLSGTTVTLAEVPPRAAELTVDGTGVGIPMLRIA